jgi:hypothetical protein
LKELLAKNTPEGKSYIGIFELAFASSYKAEWVEVRIGGALFFLFWSVSRGVPLGTLSPFIFSSNICSRDISQEQQLQISPNEVVANYE